jgi:uncharacterized RDD family membrane protein YckC
MIEKGVRIANFIVDTILIFILWIIILNVIVLFVDDFYWIEIYADLIFYAVYFFYYLLFELITSKTPGKMITRTSVKTFNQKRPTAKMIIIRSFLRIIPVDQLSFLFGSIGLHDQLSKTTVS